MKAGRDTVMLQEAYLLFYIKDTNHRLSSADTCTLLTDPAESNQVSLTHYYLYTFCHCIYCIIGNKDNQQTDTKQAAGKQWTIRPY